MSRLLLLIACLSCIACASTSAQTQTDAPKHARPNIVLIMADDLGYGDISCFNSETIHTPNIDALAARGVRFTDYHSNGAVCSPTRAALMTGRYQQRCGVEGVITARGHREVGMPLSEVTMAEMLRDAGYATAMFGKWHLGYDAQYNPIHQGFETFEGFVSGNVDYFNKIDQEGHADWWVGDELDDQPGYVTSLINQRAVQWIGEHHDRPFLLYLAHGAPHYPYQGPEDAGFRVEGQIVRQPQVDTAQTYREMIEWMDAGIGDVVAALEANGIADNTLVIFCSDNGPAGPGSAGPLRGHKGQVYEGGHRVPMVMCWPGVLEPGAQWDNPTLGMDMLPTLSALCDAPCPVGHVTDGVAVSLLVADGTDGNSRPLHWVHNDQHAIRMDPWKLIYRGNSTPELYNLDVDLAESNNLAVEMPDRVQTMRQIHEQWLNEVRQGVEPVSGR